MATEEKLHARLREASRNLSIAEQLYGDGFKRAADERLEAALSNIDRYMVDRVEEIEADAEDV